MNPTASRFLTGIIALICGVAPLAAAPTIGMGLYFKQDDVIAQREKITKLPCKPIYEQIKKQADDGLKTWANDKKDLRIEELAPEFPDLDMTPFPKDQPISPEARKAAKALEQYVDFAGPAAAYVYLMTGKRKYADFAWDVFAQASKAKRWGWFPWAGVHVPHIHFGIICRDMMLTVDCVWDTLTPKQRIFARQVIAEKCVEPYYRMVLHTPGMGLYHLRSRNQGSNVIAAALIGSLFVGDQVPDNKIWFSSLLQTYSWAITSDIGWMGGHLESGLPGYWDVSMQNLYTAAVVLNNMRGIDLRVHPGFEQATYYPIIHETTVPPVGLFKDPIAKNPEGFTGIICPKPIELPHDPRGAAWWYDYAHRFPDSPAHYFVNKAMVRPERLLVEDAHQGTLGRVLVIAWWNDDLLSPAKPPSSLAQFTDRMAGVRSGYGFNQTYLNFNGDIFLSAKNEILCTTAGLAWHFPWHQYAITESCIETEGEPFAPSMLIDRSSDEGPFTYFHARSASSNVTYYMLPGQRDSHTHYTKRDRGILFVRGDVTMPDYFLFIDEVAEKEPRWHAFNWHLWNSTANDNNYGKFAVEGTGVRGQRPNADLWIESLTPGQMTYEQQGIPSMPHVQYQMNHNAQLLRAMAGSSVLKGAKPVRIKPAAWADLGAAQDDVLYIEKPPTEHRVASKIVSGIVGGNRYRFSTFSKKLDYRAYEATAWTIELELLDKDGNIVAKPLTPHGHPDPLRIGDPMSDTLTHDWKETAGYFDAPANAVACRASFFAVGSAHYFHLGKLWLKPIELTPMGIPHRETSQRFVTLVMPLEKSAQPPATMMHAGTNSWTIGGSDVVTLDEKDGALSVVRKRSGKQFQFSSAATKEPSNTLKTNSDENAARLAAGLKPVLDEIDRERDELLVAGRKNLTTGAKVTASATRDARFAPEHVIDNQTAEYPLGGHLDYTLGEVDSSGRTIGYGAGKDSLTAGRDSWPMYVKPTYWLLPEQTLGWIELELKQPATIDTVRLLNTSNAGLNDYAASAVQVELYDSAHKLLESKDASFGKVFDAPFRQAFVLPGLFNRYTRTFEGMLDPGVAVPFGDGWKSVTFGEVKNVASVRVVVTKYWALGGGLNEVQVYGR